MTELKLLPCPFCGAEPMLERMSEVGKVYCANEDCFGPRTTAAYPHCVEQWNRRPATISRLTEELDVFMTSNAALTTECIDLRAEREGLRKALDNLIRCGNAVVGADIEDPEAADAFEMYNDARRIARTALATPSDPEARPTEDFADAFHRIRNEMEFHKSPIIAEVVSRNDGLRRIAGEKNPEYAARIIATYLALTATLPDADRAPGAGL